MSSHPRDDAFWDVYKEEDRAVERGMHDGIKHGKELGWVEGWELGVKQGYQNGLEIGFFNGSLEMLRMLQEQDGSVFSEKILSLMDRVEGLIQEFPLENTVDVDLVEKLKKIQELHKQIISLLGIGSYFTVDKDSMDF